ncbi:MAG: SRPBCC family protein [Erythrobacter sp.]|nr:SRPBCC family protein [Erythrobacter sp.]
MPKFRLPHGLAAISLLAAAPVAAEVTSSGPLGFVSRHEVVVEASPKAVWLALIAPAGWWTSGHTWSGDAANLSLTPQAGGCFCEKIPEVDEPGRFTLEGSVEHMRVIQAYPEVALRMQGALGPLQSEPVTGVLTIAISKTEAGTRIVWEYNVGGAMRYEVPVIARAVDAVMGIQLASLAKPLGFVAMPEPETSAPATEAPAEEPAPVGEEPALKPAPATKPAPTATKPVLAPAAAKPAEPRIDSALGLKPATAPATASKPVPKPAAKAPSVEDAFGDLEDNPRR